MAILQELNIFSIKFYSAMGMLWGFGSALLMDSAHTIVLTLILGFVGAVGGGLGKILINCLNSKLKKEGKKI